MHLKLQAAAYMQAMTQSSSCKKARETAEDGFLLCSAPFARKLLHPQGCKRPPLLPDRVELSTSTFRFCPVAPLPISRFLWQPAAMEFVQCVPSRKVLLLFGTLCEYGAAGT